MKIKIIQKYFLFATLFLYLVSIEAQNFDDYQVFIPGGHGDTVGFAASVNGDYAIVGAPFAKTYDKANGASKGYVFFYKKNPLTGEWMETQKTNPFDGESSDYFGGSVALYEDVAIVGAVYNNSNGINAGAAYIYKRIESSSGNINWSLVKKLVGNDTEADDLFGYSVDINNEYAVVGSLNNSNSDNDGAVYVFKRNENFSDNWDQIAKITNGSSFGPYNFGRSVSIYNNLILIGAEDFDSGGDGAAFIYEKENNNDIWNEVKRIVPSDSLQATDFSISLDLDGDNAIIGAIDADNEKGAAYIFNRNYGGENNWGEIAKLTPSNSNQVKFFGWSVSLNDNTAIVGAPFIDGEFIYSSSSPGAAYVFQSDNNSWIETKILTPPISNSSDFFGFAVSNDADDILLTAPLADSLRSDAGAIYFYGEFTPTSLNDETELPTEFSLSQNYPNPFNPTTKIKYSIPTPPKSSPFAKDRTEEGFVTLKIYDILGNEVATLVNEEQAPGYYEVEFNASRFSSGVYFYRLNAGSFNQVHKMLLLK